MVKDRILTENENIFKKILEEVIKDNFDNMFIIFPEVEIQEIIQNDNSWLYYKTRFKRVDFLLCDKHTKPIIAIEVDGNTHKLLESTIKRDVLVNNILINSNIPCCRITKKYSYKKYEVKQIIELAMFKYYFG